MELTSEAIIKAIELMGKIGINLVEASIYIVLISILYLLFRYIANNLSRISDVEEIKKNELIDILVRLEEILLFNDYSASKIEIHQIVNRIGKLSGRDEYILFKEKVMHGELTLNEEQIRIALELIEISKCRLMSKGINHINSKISLVTSIENSVRKANLPILFSSIIYSFCIAYGALLLVVVGLTMYDIEPVQRISFGLILFTFYIYALTMLFTLDNYSTTLLSATKNIIIRFIGFQVVAIGVSLHFFSGIAQVILLSINLLIYLLLSKKIGKLLKNIA